MMKLDIEQRSNRKAADKKSDCNTAVMKSKKSEGFSLVEVMVSIVLLLVLVLAGAAVMSQTGGGIQRQQNKREAIIAANTVMESVWNESYAINVARAGTTLNRTNTVNGVVMDVTITFGSEVVDAANNQQYVPIQVDVDHLGSSDDVVLSTFRYRYGLSRAELQ